MKAKKKKKRRRRRREATEKGEVCECVRMSLGVNDAGKREACMTEWVSRGKRIQGGREGWGRGGGAERYDEIWKKRKIREIIGRIYEDDVSSPPAPSHSFSVDSRQVRPVYRDIARRGRCDSCIL